MYLNLGYFSTLCRDMDASLKNIGSFAKEKVHSWSSKFVNGNFDKFISDKRGGKRGDSFCDIRPQLEGEARAFAFIPYSQKAASLTIYDLAVHQQTAL